MKNEAKELTETEIEFRTSAINQLIVAQKNRITSGSCTPYAGTMTLLALEMILKSLKEDITIILPNKIFGKKFTNSLAVCLGILQVPKVKIDDATLWLWGRSRMALVDRAYYLTNKHKFWGTFVNEVRV